MSKHRKADYLERKPSVFERLGAAIVCRSWEENGSCVLGSSCKLADTHFLVRPNLKLVAMKKGSSNKKTVKESHRRSRSTDTPSAPGWEASWEDLEGADEKDLQKRRLQLQRELRLQLKREKELMKKKKKGKKIGRSPSSKSSSSSESSSSTASSVSSPHTRKRLDRKRKASPSSGSDESTRKRKRKAAMASPKLKVIVKKKVESPRKPVVLKKTSKKSSSPAWERRVSPKKKTPVRLKARAPSPKHKVREPSPRRVVKPKERRVTPPRPARPRSAERRRHHSPRRRREADRGGLEKGGKILPVKSSAYVKEMKESGRRKSTDRLRDEREKEREKEKRRRDQKVRETERREREREGERIRRETERQKDREEVIDRSRDRRDRDRIDRGDKDKRMRDSDHRKSDKNDLPSLMEIKTEVPPPQKSSSRRSWEERRSRRGEDSFEFRRLPVEDVKVVPEDRRTTRKVLDYAPESSAWEGKEEFRESSAGGEWSRDWKHRDRYDPKWSGEGGGREREREWREHYPNRRPAEWIAEPPLEDQPCSEVIPQVEPPRRPNEPPASENIPIAESVAVERPADLEEVLSDISDDADDILNQDDEPVSDPVELQPVVLPAACISQQGAEFFFDHRRPLLECLTERGLDFEEISDEDLEEEAKMSKGIMDVLGADWASLLKQTPVKAVKSEAAGTARRRWRIDGIISRIGFSLNLVGKEFADKYIAKIDEECKEADNDTLSSQEDSQENLKIKVEPVENNDERTQDNTTQDSVKTEMDKELMKTKKEEKPPVNEEDSIKAKVEREKLMIKLPGVYSALDELRGDSMIHHLLHSKYKRALSARTDLSIRRIMCGISSKEPLHFTLNSDDKLYESSVTLFKAILT